MVNKIKVAIIFEDSPDVSHWDKGGLQGLKEAKERYGIDYTYIIREDTTIALKTLGKQDYDIIISHDNLTWDNVVKIAPEFPNIWFGVPSIDPNSLHPSNVFSYTPDWIQAAYLIGLIAGKMTKTNKIGAPTPFLSYPTSIAHMESFKLGAKTVNPNAKVFIIEHRTHKDFNKGKETALSLINQGCDFFKTFAGPVDQGVFEALKENDLYCVATEPVDVKGVSDRILATGTYSFRNCLADIIGEYLAKGDLENKDYYGNITKGWVELYWDRLELVPNNVKELVEVAKQDMMDNRLSIPWKYDLTTP
jgi:basic membrane lipoprotein Med (substrate-binding protein (PBP1-ABC) superfamily)